MLRHSLILLAANQIGNAAHILFHMIMGRALEPQEYGVLAAMLGIILIVATPTDALRMALAHLTALLQIEGKAGAVPHLVRRLCRNMLPLAAAVLVIGLWVAGPITEFFQLGHRMPIVLTTLILAGALFLPILIGALLGLQAFIWMSVRPAKLGRDAPGRECPAVLFFSATAEAALTAQLLGVAVSGALGGWGLVAVLRSARTDEHITGVIRYFLQSFVILAGYAVLSFCDVVLVKHYFDPVQVGPVRAGRRRSARTVFFLPMPIAMALFPKVASTGTIEDQGSWKNLGLSCAPLRPGLVDRRRSPRMLAAAVAPL